MSTEDAYRPSRHAESVEHAKRMLAAAARKRAGGQDAYLDDLIAQNAVDLAMAGLDEANRRREAERDKENENGYQ